VRVRIYHNPRCTTSRKAKAALEGAGAEVEVVEYLKGKVPRAEWAALLDAVGGDPTRLLRSREPLYKDLKLEQRIAAGKVGREQVLDLLVQHPQLLERPVLLAEGRGLIARPAEKALDVLR
jgi:arsenate reductase (glutaredoxin)